MDAQQLYETLKKTQEAKGYCFSSDRERVVELLGALLINKSRYGHMAGPSRLAAGEPDVAEYGSCYCNLYVSDACNAGTVPHVYVPERRPPEKTAF